jgi:hypothetical protein
MNTKLTLTIDESVINKAKRYAKGQGRSLSDMVENYFKAIVKDQPETAEKGTPITNSLRGSFKDDDFDYKESLTEELAKKYL